MFSVKIRADSEELVPEPGARVLVLLEQYQDHTKVSVPVEAVCSEATPGSWTFMVDINGSEGDYCSAIFLPTPYLTMAPNGAADVFMRAYRAVDTERRELAQALAVARAETAAINGLFGSIALTINCVAAPSAPPRTSLINLIRGWLKH